MLRRHAPSACSVGMRRRHAPSDRHGEERRLEKDRHGAEVPEDPRQELVEMPVHIYSYGLYSYGLYSYGLYSYGLYSNGL